MRLAQSSVQVNVVGDDKVGTFETVEAAAYLLLHEKDLEQLIKNTRLLSMVHKIAPDVVRKARETIANQEKGKPK